jgi:hypothetical protein
MPKPISPMDTMPMHDFGTAVAAEDEDEDVSSMLGWCSVTCSVVFGQHAIERGGAIGRWYDRVVQATEMADTELRAR